MATTRKIRGCLHEEKAAKISETGGSAELPRYCGEAAVDIIAVHGLASKYERTWNVQLEDGSRYHWLREKLPADIPQARVLGYEYGSDWYGDPTYTNLEECGAELLRCIIRDRCHRGRPAMCPTRRSRPIIFIAHSFGGLVVKQALVIAYKKWAEEERYKGKPSSGVRETVRRAQAINYRDLLSTVAGVVFLGTPHRGSAFSYWAEVKMTLGSLTGQSTNPELVKVLRANSEPLNALQQDFEEACKDSKLSDLLLYCYRETREVPLPPKIVVPRESAWLDGAEKKDLDANHMDMNKFHPGKDANYDKILVDILHIFHSAAQSVPKRLEAWCYNSFFTDGDRIALQRRLNPSQTAQVTQYHAKLASHQAAPYTCRWIEQLEDFSSWKAGTDEQNVLWVNGKPGSGKSVLAAYIINHFKKSADETTETKYRPCYEPLRKHPCGFKLTVPTILYFFCGVDRAHEDAARLLGTLIHQLLSVHDHDDTLFAEARSFVSTKPDGVGASALVELLKRLLSLLQNQVLIIVDGLEENRDFEQCLHCLTTVASSGNTRLLILSQPVELLRKELEWQWNVRELSITDYSHPDICQYTELRIVQLLNRKPNLEPKRDMIIETLQSDARGVFQWVNSALDHLENRVAHVDDVEDGLKDLPGDLRDAYEKIFSRMKWAKLTDQLNSRIQTALRFLAVSATPVTVMELETALDVYNLVQKGQRGSLERIWTSKWSVDHQHEVAKDLRSLLESLIEIDANNFVSLVHPSLRTALLQAEGQSCRESEAEALSNYRFSLEDAHYRVALICVPVCGDSTLAHANAFAETKSPFIEYAWNYWAYHLRASDAEMTNPRLRSALDRMLYRVHRDAISFLGALADFSSGPLDPVPGFYSILEYWQSLQRAQDSLPPAIQALCLARKNIPVAAKLQEVRKRIPGEVFDVHVPGRYERAMRWLNTTRSYLRDWLLKDRTRVTRVSLDDLMEQPAFSNLDPYPSTVGALLDASRSLRLVALRFAVNPVYTALIQRAGGSSFSPINTLVYVAQILEETASFPYWQHLPELLDPAEAFLCNNDDPQAGPAKFVLQSVEWKRPSKELAAELKLSGRPEPLFGLPAQSNGRLGQSSAEQERQVRQLHEMPGDRWMMAQFAFGTFRTDGWFQAFIADPVSNLQIKKKLLLLQDSEKWPAFMSPETTLNWHAPTSVRKTPVAEALKAIPSLLRVLYVKYVTTLLELFAQVPRAGVVTHFIQLTTSKQEMLECARYAKRFVSRANWQRLWHVLPALFLYWLRCKLYPSLGAHAMAHPWNTLLLAYRHSAAYLDLQSTHDAWFWLKYAFTTRLHYAIGGTFVQYGADPSNHGLFVSDTIATFYQIITLERNIFGLGFAGAMLVASANIILYNRENLPSVLSFTFWYWIVSGFTIFNALAAAVLQQSRASFLYGLGVMVFEAALFIGLVYYEKFALRVLYWLLSPIVLPAMILWKTVLYAYAPFLKICGVVVFIYMALLAVYWLNKTISDPYDLEGSLKAVKKASELATSVLEESETMHIGQYPLGGPKDANTQEQNLNVGTEELLLHATEETWDSRNGRSDPADSREAMPEPQEQDPSYSTRDTTADFNLGTVLSKLGAEAATTFNKAFSDAREVLQNTAFSIPNQPNGRYSSGRGGFGLHYNSYSHESITTTTINGYTTNSYSSSSHSSWSSTPVSYGRLGRNRWSDDYYTDTSLWNGNSRRGIGGGHFGNKVISQSEYDVHARRFQDDWDRQEMCSRVFMGLMVLIVVAILWGVWTGWLSMTCWYIGVPLGPFYVGYGCEGFFWKLLL